MNGLREIYKNWAPQINTTLLCVGSGLSLNLQSTTTGIFLASMTNATVVNVANKIYSTKMIGPEPSKILATTIALTCISNTVASLFPESFGVLSLQNAAIIAAVNVGANLLPYMIDYANQERANQPLVRQEQSPVSQPLHAQTLTTTQPEITNQKPLGTLPEPSTNAMNDYYWYVYGKVNDGFMDGDFTKTNFKNFLGRYVTGAPAQTRVETSTPDGQWLLQNNENLYKYAYEGCCNLLEWINKGSWPNEQKTKMDTAKLMLGMLFTETWQTSGGSMRPIQPEDLRFPKNSHFNKDFIHMQPVITDPESQFSSFFNTFPMNAELKSHIKIEGNTIKWDKHFWRALLEEITTNC